MISCSNCGKPLHTDDASILWQDEYIDGKYTVGALIVVHRACDDAAYHNSAGCVYGKNWSPDEHGGALLKEAVFAKPADKELYDRLITQRRKDHRAGEPPYDQIII